MVVFRVPAALGAFGPTQCSHCVSQDDVQAQVRCSHCKLILNQGLASTWDNHTDHAKSLVQLLMVAQSRAEVIHTRTRHNVHASFNHMATVSDCVHPRCSVLMIAAAYCPDQARIWE